MTEDSTEPVSTPAEVEERAFRERAAFVDAIEARLLGEPRTLSRSEVADRAEVSQEEARGIWRAMGFADAGSEARIFTEADVTALRALIGLVHDGVLTHEVARNLTRAYGRSMDRLTMWQTQLLSDLVAGVDGPEMSEDVARRTAELTVSLMDTLEPLLLYVWRRDVSQAISRLVADTERTGEIGVRRTVGFADLVSFTQLVRTLSERDLARLVSRFEELASDVVSAHGGALVKTVGDEILFTHENVADAASIALDLTAAVQADEIIPHLRIGLSMGRVLARQGDVYGETVNRAARLTAAARPGGRLIDHEVAWGLSTDERFRCEELPPIELSGIGRLRPWTLDWASPRGAEPLDVWSAG